MIIFFASAQQKRQKNLLHFNQVIIKMRDNKLVITTEPKSFSFNLPKNVSTNFKYGIDSIIKQNEYLAYHPLKNGIRQLLSKYKHGNKIHQYRKQ